MEILYGTILNGDVKHMHNGDHNYTVKWLMKALQCTQPAAQLHHSTDIPLMNVAHWSLGTFYTVAVSTSNNDYPDVPSSSCTNHGTTLWDKLTQLTRRLVTIITPIPITCWSQSHVAQMSTTNTLWMPLWSDFQTMNCNLMLRSFLATGTEEAPCIPMYSWPEHHHYTNYLIYT